MHLTRVTRDAATATDWFQRFEGAGLDGVVAKALELPYQPGKRVMLKIKHARTADAVVVGYRVHKSGQGVGSLLLGLYTDEGQLVNVGGISAFTNARRLELVDELADLVVTDEHGEAVKGETDRSRFSGNKDVSFVRLRPERVVEVKFDQLEGARSGTPSRSCAGARTASPSRAPSTRWTAPSPTTWPRCSRADGRPPLVPRPPPINSVPRHQNAGFPRPRAGRDDESCGRWGAGASARSPARGRGPP